MTPAPNRRLSFLLTLAQRRVQNGAQANRAGVTPTQAGALFLLGSPDGMLIGDVGRALGLGAAGMSGLADRMEAAGLVRRVPSPVDGRAVALVLTDEGRRMRELAKTRAAEINARLTDGFTAEELDVVARWLARVAERFEKDENA